MIKCLCGPPFDLLDFESSTVDGQAKVLDVIVGDDVENDGFEFGLGHGFALLGILVEWHGMPDHLSWFEEALVVIAVVLLDESKKIIHDGRSSDGSFIVAIVVQEAVHDDVLERFALHALVLTKGDGRRRKVRGVPGEKA